MSLTPHAARNREAWDRDSDEYQELHRQQLAQNPMAWGIWSIPEAELHALGEVADKDVLELGCGGAQWAVALAQKGARVVGLDNSARQLDYARELQAEKGVEFPLVHASGEEVPLPDASFDLVFCDHGALTFCDPHLVVPEAARLLRPGGLLVFNMSSPLFHLCWDEEADAVSDRLQIDYYDMHRFVDETNDHVEFQLPYGGWIRLFRQSGFVVEDLIELRPPKNAETSYEGYGRKEWAGRWPVENLWRVRKEAR